MMSDPVNAHKVESNYCMHSNPYSTKMSSEGEVLGSPLMINLS